MIDNQCPFSHGEAPKLRKVKGHPALKETGTNLSPLFDELVSNIDFLESEDFKKLVPTEKVTMVSAFWLKVFWEEVGEELILRLSDKESKYSFSATFEKIFNEWFECFESTEEEERLSAVYKDNFNEGSVLSIYPDEEIPESITRGFSTMNSFLKEMGKTYGYNLSQIEQNRVFAQIFRHAKLHIHASKNAHSAWDKKKDTPTLKPVKSFSHFKSFLIWSGAFCVDSISRILGAPVFEELSDFNKLTDKPRVGCPWVLSGVAYEMFVALWPLYMDPNTDSFSLHRYFHQ